MDLDGGRVQGTPLLCLETNTRKKTMEVGEKGITLDPISTPISSGSDKGTTYLLCATAGIPTDGRMLSAKLGSRM